MIILQQKSADKCHTICLFGIGLLGTSILSNLHNSASFMQKAYGFSWCDTGLQAKQAALILKKIIGICETNLGNGFSSQRLTFVWSAGQGGFQDSMENLQNELHSFTVVQNMVAELVGSLSEISINFHLLSSAGGLFEGQRFITSNLSPAPKRAYGYLKLQQERQLQNLDPSVSKYIYRPSSVYGFVNSTQRMGLIPKLLYNNFNNKMTTIFGSFSTLRDYVYQGDIGTFIADTILRDLKKGDLTIMHLCSGRPSSIYEIKHIIEKVTGKKIYYSFQEITSNTSDITFSNDILPPAWSPIDIERGIKKIYHRLSYQLAL